MNRLTKIIYFSLLFLVAFSQLIAGNMLLSLGLIGLVAFAIQWFEKREASRQFYRALRKLYVCVDIRAYEAELEKLKKNRLIKSYSEAKLQLLEAIALYYLDRRVEAIKVLSSLDVHKDMAFWKQCYLLLIQLDIGSDQVLKADQKGAVMALYKNILESLKHVPYFFKEIANQRIMVFELMIKDEVEIADIERLRDLVKYNLFIAELTSLLANYTKEDRLKAYYKRGVVNLSKGLTI